MTELVRSYSPESLLKRIRAEFIEMPGLRLSLEQAQRLWSLDSETCRGVLALLVDARFLLFGADHKYRRFSSESLESRLQTTNAPTMLARDADRVVHSNRARSSGSPVIL